ncbi:MAG: hypothetical protein JWN69_1060 [Alphaproteobacteria bacterium]|jgi:uncharacterized protein YegP (UPF0339 family)|nr:hypothetical protein [Alphaproteobacteria bacterium]
MAAKRPSPSFLIFRDQQGNWRWNFVGPSGRVIAASRVAYQQRAGCVRAIRLLQGSANVPVLARARDVKQAVAPVGGQTEVPAGNGEETLELTEMVSTPENTAAEAEDEVPGEAQDESQDEALTKV